MPKEMLSIRLFLRLLFLLNLFLSDELLPLDLDILPLLLHVQVYHLIEFLLIIAALLHQHALSSGVYICLGLVKVVTLACSSLTTDRSHTHILIKEVLVAKIIEECSQIDHRLLVIVSASEVISINHISLNLFADS